MASFTLDLRVHLVTSNASAQALADAVEAVRQTVQAESGEWRASGRLLLDPEPAMSAEIPSEAPPDVAGDPGEPLSD